MANEKKPSLYVDRGTIGSSDELDEYGVWVKSEPQDIGTPGPKGPWGETLSQTSDLSESDDPDFEIPEIDDFPDFDSLEAEVSNSFGRLKDQPEMADDDDLPLPDLPDLDDLDDLSDPDEDILQDDLEVFADESVDDNSIFDLEDLGGQFASSSEEAEDKPFDFSVYSGQFKNLELVLNSVDSEESAQEGGPDIDFDEISMDELVGPIETADSDQESAQSKTVSSDLSTQLLMKIADELASIRSELSTLKKEFSVVGGSPASFETKPEKDGFFAGDDDETIALTGDELNNIINTADFSEEEGLDAAPEAALDEQEDESFAFEPTPEDTAYLAEDPVLEDIAIEEPEIISLEDISLEEDVSGESSLEETSLEEASLDEMPLDEMPLEEEALDEIPLEEMSLEEPLGEPMEELSLELEEADSSDSVESDESGADSDYLELAELEPVELDEEELDLPALEPLELEPLEAEADEMDPSDLVSIELSVEEPDFAELETESDAEGGDTLLIPEAFELPDESTFAELEEITEEDDVSQVAADLVLDAPLPAAEAGEMEISPQLKQELKAVLSYMDQLLESLPDEKIEEFARSEYFDTYKKLFKELGLV